MMGTVDVTSGAVGRARLISKTLNVTDVSGFTVLSRGCVVIVGACAKTMSGRPAKKRVSATRPHFTAA